MASTDSERYSLKIEFDHYSDGKTYHGLDKLNLNNLVADNTYLKDYLSYDMMAYMGVDASTDEATTLVNYAIDTPVSGTTMEERPLLNELLSNEKYLTLYHQYYDEFITGYFDSGQCQATIDKAAALIATAVADDPTAFCTNEEYEARVAVLKQFCDLRAQSVSGQLDGTIPATTTGQTQQPDTLIDASAIDTTAMGSNLMIQGNAQTITANTTVAENTQAATEAPMNNAEAITPADTAATTRITPLPYLGGEHIGHCKESCSQGEKDGKEKV